MANIPVISFNAGHMTPKIDTRSDTEKYSSGCRIIENMLPLIYGPAERRPGTEYIATAKNSPQGIRLIPFIYSATIAYMMEFGDLYARFYFDGSRVLSGTDIVEVVTPYLVADLPQVQYDQSADVMWLVHSSYPPYKLSRTTASSFSMAKIVFTNGPFLERNDIAVEDDVTMATNVTAAAAVGTMTASSATFENGHRDSIWKLTHKREDSVVKGSATGTGVIDAAIDVKGPWTFTTHGNWDATIEIQRNEDGTNWETFRSYTSVITNNVGSRNVQKTDIEKSDGVQYRMNVTEYTSGTVEADFTVNSPTLDGIVRIDGITSSTLASITVLSKVASTDATNRWAEGAWSGVRGYPTSFTLFEERAVYAGSTNNPQRVWFSGTGEFEDFDAGTFGSDSFAVDVQTANTIRWVASLDALMVGTSGDEWRIRATTLDAALTPDNWDIRQQTVRGCRNIQALKVNEAVLFVDKVGRKVRELTYSDERQKFVSPDLTALAEDITKTGITSIAHQRNPDSIVWSTLADGTLLSMTYEREQNVVAWAKHLVGLTKIDTTSTTLIHYPILRELTEAEIPSQPAEPSNTALSGETSVTTKVGLQAITGSGHYSIDADIDCSGGDWTPITSFSGVIEGNGYTISNMTVAGGASDDQGFIGTADTGCEIRNLIFDSCTVSGRNHLGIVIGDIDTKNSIKLTDVNITNSSVIDTVGQFGDAAGALIGYAHKVYTFNIWRCTSTDTSVETNTTAGGLIGWLTNATGGECNIIDSYVSSSTVTGDDIGGLIAIADGLSAAEPIIIHSCYSTMAVYRDTDNGTNEAGGLIGFADFADITSCYATGNVDIDDATAEALGMGGFIGFMFRGDIINCYSTGNVSTRGDTYLAGGFIGKFDILGNTVTRCFSTGNVTVLNYIGTSTYIVGQIGGFIGGLLGSTSDDNSIIRRCWSTGDVSVHNGQNMQSTGGVGGFTGLLETYPPTIENCYCWGSVTFETDNTPQHIGGFVGYILADGGGFSLSRDATITNCYNAQTDSKFGSGYENQIYNKAGESGGFLGVDDSVLYNADCTASYWDGDTSGLTADASDGAVSHTTEWLMTESNFEDAGWDMDDIWIIEPVVTLRTGLVESVATIPGTNEDEVWVAVLRAINGSLARYIERMKLRDWGDDQADCFFVDSGLSYDGTATNTFTNLGHLEGETVAILGDGAVYATEVVSSGSVTIRDSVEKAHIGLPFKYRLKPMRLDVNTPSGTTSGSIKKISEIVISFLETGGAQYGDGVDTRSIDWRTTEVYDTPPALFTGMKPLSFDGGFSVEDPIIISGEEPLPATIRAIIPRVEKTGR